MVKKISEKEGIGWKGRGGVNLCIYPYMEDQAPKILMNIILFFVDSY